MRKIFMMLWLILILSSCSGLTKAPAVSPSATVTGNPAAQVVDNKSEGYPAPQVEKAYPAPQSAPNPTAGPTWTPDATRGRVNGTLLYNGQPVANAHLYLGAFLKNSQGVEFTAALDPARSPSAYTDAQGNFSFINVPPGRYGLIMDNVASSYLLYKPGTQESFTLDVAPGGTVDIGKQDFDELPMPGEKK